MESDLFFDNKKYITAKDAADLIGYSKDYIGQLCRANKILAKRVGNVWYVSEASLLEYKNTPNTFDFFRQAKVNTKDQKTEQGTPQKNQLERQNENNEDQNAFENLSRPKLTNNFIDDSMLVPNIDNSYTSLDSEKFQILSKHLGGSDGPSTQDNNFSTLGSAAALSDSISKNITSNKKRNLFILPKVAASLLAIIFLFGLLSFSSYKDNILNSFAKANSEDSKDLISNSGDNTAAVVNSTNANNSNSIFASLGHTIYDSYTILNSWLDNTIYHPMYGLFTGSSSSKINSLISSNNNTGSSTPSNFFKGSSNETNPTPNLRTNGSNTNTKTGSNSLKNSSTSVANSASLPTVINSTNIIERIVERAILPDVNKAYVDSKIQQASNDLSSRFYSLTSSSGNSSASIPSIYREISLTQRIDQLTNTLLNTPTINNPTINGGTINGATLSNITISGLGTTTLNNLSVSNTSTSTFSGGISITGGCISVNGVCLGVGGGSGTPGGLNGQIQFNNAGAFAGASGLVWDSINSRLGIGTSSPYAALGVSGSVVADNFFATGTTATSTFSGGVSVGTLAVTGTISSSTFANGINLTGGCFAVNGSCVNGSSVLTFSYPLLQSGNAISLAFGTTTSNLWSQLQTFSNSSTTLGSFTYASTTNLFVGTLVLNGTDLQTALNSKSTFAFPYTVTTGYNSTSTTIGFTSGLFSTASSTFSGSFRLPSLSNGELAVYGGLVGSYATTTAGTGLTYSGNAFNLNTTQNITTLSNLTSNGVTYTAGSNGTLNTVSTSTPTIGTTLSYSGTIGQLLGGTSGTLSLNLASANTWSALQTFAYSSTTYGSFITASTTNLVLNGSNFTSLLGTGLSNVGGALTVDTTTLNNSINSYVNSSTTIPKTYIANTFTALQTFTNSSTSLASFTYASSTNDFIGTLSATQGTFGSTTVNATTTTSGLFASFASLLTTTISNLTASIANITTATIASLTNYNATIGTLTATSSVSTPTLYASSTLANNVTTGTLVATSSITLASLNGPLQANNGVVSATTSVGTIYGGTGLTTYATGDILYASSANTLSKLSASSNGLVLKLVGGVPTWQTDITSNGGGGATAWSTSTNSQIIYPTDTSNILVLGANGTSTLGNIFEVVGNSLLGGNVRITGNASTTQLSSGVAYFGGTATSTFSSNGALTLGGVSVNSILSTNSSGVVVATSTITVNNIIATGTTATSTFSGGVSVGTLAVTGTISSSTFANGINLTGGCFAVNGSCLNSFINSIGSGGTGNTTFAAGGVVYSDGTKLTTSASASDFYWNETTKSLGIGGTPSYTLDVKSAQANSRLKSTTGANSVYSTFENTGGLFFFGKESSVSGAALLTGDTAYGNVIASSNAAPIQFGVNDNLLMTITSSAVGVGTSTPGSLFSIGDTNGINFSTATSTFSSIGGLSLKSGCFAINGTCVGTNDSINDFIAASSTIPKTYTANTFLSLQTFTNASTSLLSSTYASSTNEYIGNLFLPQVSQGFAYTGTNGLTQTIASSSIKLSWFNNDLGFATFAFPYTVTTGYNSTSTTIGFTSGLFSTASSTFSGSFRLPSLSNGELAVYGGLVGSYATTTAGTGLTHAWLSL